MPLNLENIDLGGFGIGDDDNTQPEVNTELRANMNEALKIDPDQHAKTTNLSKQSGVPEFAVESDPAQVEHELKLDNIDFAEMSVRSPNTAKYLTDFNNSVIAQDDIDILQSIEDVFDFGKTFENISESISTGFSAQEAGLRMVGVDMTPDRIEDLIPMGVMPIGMEMESLNISREIARQYGVETDEQLQQLKEESTETVLTELRDLHQKRADLTPEDLNLLEEGVRAGIESLANMAPGFGLMLASGGRAAPMLATIGVQTFGDSYGQGRAEGLTPQEAGWFASIDAAIEVGTEILPTGTLETILTGKSTGMTKSALKFLVQEMGTEQLATLGQSLNSFAFGLDEQMEQAETVGEMVDIQLRRQAVTAIATVVAGGAQAAAVTGIRKSVEALTQDEAKKETQGEIEQRKIDTLNEKSTESKLRERDKESFKQFVEEADGENNTHVFIDGAQTALYMQDKTPEEIAADPALKMLSEQAREASGTGGDVQVPVADFAAEIAGTEHYEALRDSMTMSAETMAPFRQDQAKQETETYVRNLMEEAQESASEYVEAQEIYTTVRDQLIDTGQVTPANSSIMAQVVPAWATAQARRQGKTVQQVYQDAGLVIEGPQTGEAARLAGEQVLEQPAYKDAPVLFEAARDKYLDVLPEDATVDEVMESVDEFGPEYKNFINALDRDDWLGFDIPSQAIDAVLSEEADQFDMSQGLKQSIGKLVNAEAAGEQPFAEKELPAMLQEQERVDVEPAARAPSVEDFQAFQPAVEIESTETEEFKAWSGNGEVVESEDVNDHVFKANTPTVVKVFHGTTHKFDVFDALRGNLEGQFGAINYFTSSEQDATDNYAGEGPDLTGRIDRRAEQLESEIQEVIDDVGLDAAIEQFVPGVDQFVEDASDIAQIIAKQELSGGQDQTMELFVRVDNPFVIGENAEWIEFVDNEAIQTDAIEQVADDNDITVEEVNENIDDYQDEIDEKRWDIEAGTENALAEAIQTVSDRHDVNAVDLAGQVYELGAEATPDTIENLLRESEDYQYAEDPESGELIQSQLIAEVIEEMGFDSIILRNADDRFSTMDIEQGTAHVHIFDSGKTNIKSVENIGTFDPTDPNIFRQPSDKPRAARGYYDPANSVIRLSESSDLSTFLHEFAHFMYEMEVNGNTEMLQSINNWYKRNAEDVAKEAESYINGEFDAQKQGERTSEEPVKVSSEEVTAYLDQGTSGNTDKDSAIRRAVHEQFARGFETYLMEGKAPSIELRNAFRAFARWLSRIYQALRGDLDVSLDQEMRQVFDRLLATEEQIQAAEARARVEPMFTDAAMAGMTEAEFADYQVRQEKVKDVQSETLRDKIIKQLTRQTEAWWKEEKQDIIDEEIDQLKKEQVYKARAELKDGAFKIDHATVKEMVGEEKTNKLGRKSVVIPPELRGMTAKGMAGVHPDEAAAFFGYRSGSEMLGDLVNAPKIKVAAETAAEARMVERHGDILTDGTIEQQADEAVQNEERGKLILHELKALAKGTNAPTIDRATIKALSEERIGRLSFREIHPGKYRKAEVRAAQESARMLAEGNKEGAAAAKMRQVMNYYLGMAATNAKNETTKIVDRMSRYNKKKVREEIQKSEGGYWDQIVKILDRFEFKKTATLKEVESLNVWMNERNGEAGDALVLTNPVLNESYVTHWKNVPFSDLQGINDSVKNIEHVARYANKLTRMQEEIDFNKLVDRWITSMNDKVETRFESKRTDVVEGRKWGRWFMAQMTKVPFMASWLDGGERAGISHQIMVQPFTDAYNAEIKLWEAAGKPIMDAIENRSKADRKRHNQKYYIPEIDDNLYGHQIIAVALNTGNQSNLKKMLLGEGWADPEVETEITFDNAKLQAVLSRMTRSDWTLVQQIWDQMETLYPQLAEVHRRTTGLTPPKVESAPFVARVGGVAGEDINMRGGYYPVKYDPNRDHRAALNEDKLNAETESMFSNNASIQASVNTGATNERTGYYAPIRLSLDVVPAHFQETIHYITHHDAVREVNRLTRNKQVAQTIKEKLGPEEYAQLRPWLNDIAKDGREAPVKMFWDDMLQKLRFGVTLGTMGFKASTGIIQISGLSNTIAEVGLNNVMQSTRLILGSTTTIKQAWDFAVENSQVLEHRTQTMDREIKNAMKRIEGKRGVLAAAQEASMKHIALIQAYMVDLPSWHAAYMKGMTEWGDEARAFQYADWVIENVQGSGATKDMAKIMRGQSETGRMFTMFMTFFSSLWNMERDLVKGAKAGTYSTTSVAAKAMFLFTVPVLFEMMMRGELGEPEDEDDRLQSMLTKVAMFPVQSIPFVRDVASATTGEFGYNISPLASVIEQGTRTIPQIVTRGFTDEEITKGQVKGATKFIGAATGIPGVNQAWATGEHLYDVIEEGEEFTVHQLLFGPERK
jgi:hypothetical protein